RALHNHCHASCRPHFDYRLHLSTSFWKLLRRTKFLRWSYWAKHSNHRGRNPLVRGSYHTLGTYSEPAQTIQAAWKRLVSISGSLSLMLPRPGRTLRSFAATSDQFRLILIRPPIRQNLPTAEQLKHRIPADCSRLPGSNNRLQI